MNNETQNKEAISALTDSQLSGEIFAATSQQMLNDPNLLATWHSYHVIGDALRSAELAQCHGDAGFLVRFRARLDEQLQQPSVLISDENLFEGMGLATDRVAVNANPEMAANQFNINTGTAAANASWKWLALAASVVAIGAIGWNTLALNVSGSEADQLAQSSASGSVQIVGSALSEPVMLRDARLDELLAAHKQLGGTSALQMPAGFLRNATFDGSAVSTGR